MKYDNHYENTKTPILAAGETVLWHGKPKKSAFVATKSLTMLPIAIIWLIFDLGFISVALSSGDLFFFIIPFFALHLMPVWIWLANVLTAKRRWKNTAYYVTNRRIIIQHGFLAVNETSLFFKDIRNVELRIGLIDKLFHTGDIRFDANAYVDQKQTSGHSFEDLEDPNEAYAKIQKIIFDIQTDIEYPNALRPDDNFGYNTDYRG